MKKVLLTAMAIVAMATVTANAGLIYSDDFSGGPGDINGTAPDVDTTGGAAAWVAAAAFNQDGSMDAGPGSMTLAFTPQNGQIYALDVSVRGVGPVTSGDWLALGFAKGQSDATSTGSRFINNNVIGQAWMFVKAQPDKPDNSFYGGGTSNPGVWDEANGPFATDVDMRIVLDTTGGTGNWAVTWYAKSPMDSDYTQVRDPAVLPTTTTINSVGVASSGSGIRATIESFSLTSIPEPATLALLSLGGLTLLRRRKG